MNNLSNVCNYLKNIYCLFRKCRYFWNCLWIFFFKFFCPNYSLKYQNFYNLFGFYFVFSTEIYYTNYFFFSFTNFWFLPAIFSLIAGKSINSAIILWTVWKHLHRRKSHKRNHRDVKILLIFHSNISNLLKFFFLILTARGFEGFQFFFWL